MAFQGLADFRCNIDSVGAHDVRVREPQHAKTSALEFAVAVSVELKGAGIVMMFLTVRLDHKTAGHQKVHPPYPVNKKLRVYWQPCLRNV